MVITTEVKLTKTFGETRSVEAHHRPAIEIDSFTEEPISLPPGNTREITVTKGLVLVSASEFPVAGDINLTIDRFFVCYSPLSITITNDEDNTSNLEVRAYIFN